MLGKIAGAWLGKKAAGRNQGTKGALLGIGAAALARRSVPALAAVAALGWGYRKYKERRARRATYPSEATPSSS
ncbi:MAG: hypothetical protein ACREBK_02760 [Sphingomicrobium sp.]